jgi:ankyrin repeat protein
MVRQCDRCTNIARVTESTGTITARTTNEDGFSALHMAALHGCVEIAKLLLDHGALVAQETLLKHTALHFACQYNHSEVWG